MVEGGFEDASVRAFGEVRFLGDDKFFEESALGNGREALGDEDGIRSAEAVRETETVN